LDEEKQHVADQPQQDSKKTEVEYSKIRIKGQIYFLSKSPDHNGDFPIYGENLKDIVGRKTSTGSYRMNKM